MNAGERFYIKSPLQLCRVLCPHSTACNGESLSSGSRALLEWGRATRSLAGSPSKVGMTVFSKVGGQVDAVE